MPFAYYSTLSKSDQLIYRKSDKIEFVPIKNAEALRTEVNTLERALKGEDRKAVQSLAHQLLNTFAKNLGTPLLNIRVLSCRPANVYVVKTFWTKSYLI